LLSIQILLRVCARKFRIGPHSQATLARYRWGVRRCAQRLGEPSSPREQEPIGRRGRAEIGRGIERPVKVTECHKLYADNMPTPGLNMDTGGECSFRYRFHLTK
jgi:hypothetical protein